MALICLRTTYEGKWERVREREGVDVCACVCVCEREREREGEREKDCWLETKNLKPPAKTSLNKNDQSSALHQESRQIFFSPPLKSGTVIGDSHQESEEADLLQSVSAAQQSVQNTGTYCSRDRYVASQSDSDRSQQTSEPAFILTPYLLVLFGQMQRSSPHPRESNRDDADELCGRNWPCTFHKEGLFTSIMEMLNWKQLSYFFLRRNEALDYMGEDLASKRKSWHPRWTEQPVLKGGE